jgi:hypothetical protein
MSSTETLRAEKGRWRGENIPENLLENDTHKQWSARDEWIEYASSNSFEIFMAHMIRYIRRHDRFITSLARGK